MDNGVIFLQTEWCKKANTVLSPLITVLQAEAKPLPKLALNVSIHLLDKDVSPQPDSKFLKGSIFHLL